MNTPKKFSLLQRKDLLESRDTLGSRSGGFFTNLYKGSLVYLLTGTSNVANENLSTRGRGSR